MSKRDKILQTTLDIAANYGLQATSIPLIIKESNTAAGTLYYHFQNKEELIDTLYSEIKEEMGNAFIQNIDQVSNFKERFFLIWKNLFTFYMDNPKKFEFLQQYVNSHLAKKEIKAITRRHYQPVIDLIQSGIQLGILRDLPIDYIINLIFSNVSILVKMILMEEIELTENLLNNAIQSSWDSVKVT